jgi:restriction endonuclease S subunit
LTRLSAAQQRQIDNAVINAATRLVFDEMRNTFRPRSLSDVIEIHNGQGLRSDKRDPLGAFNVYAAGGEVGRHSDHLTDAPFVVIGRKGSAGKITYAPCGGWVIDTAYYAQPRDPSELDTKFLAYALSSLDFSSDIISTAIPGINRTAIYKHRISVPPRPVQAAIVHFLDAAMSGDPLQDLPTPLEHLRRIVARIEELAAKIEEARGLRQSAIAEADALWTSSLRDVFETVPSFPHVPLETVCLAIIDNLHANPVYADDGVPCIRSSDVGWGRLSLDTARRTSEAEYQRRTVRGEPQPDDIVFVREGGGTGKVAIVLDGQRFSLAQRVMMVRPDLSKIDPRYFLYQLLSPQVQENQIRPLIGGSAAPHLNIRHFKTFGLVLPPLPRQREVVRHLDALSGRLDRLRNAQTATAAELDALLPAVLDKAFIGEL